MRTFKVRPDQRDDRPCCDCIVVSLVPQQDGGAGQLQPGRWRQRDDATLFHSPRIVVSLVPHSLNVLVDAGLPWHGLSCNIMSLITSDCGLPLTVVEDLPGHADEGIVHAANIDYHQA